MTELITNKPIAPRAAAPDGLIATLMLGGDKTPAEEFEKDRRKGKGEMTEDDEVEEGLEETFPASDPVSVTRTDKPAGAKD